MAEDLLLIAVDCNKERDTSRTLPPNLRREANFQHFFKPLSIVLL